MTAVHSGRPRPTTVSMFWAQGVNGAEKRYTSGDPVDPNGIFYERDGTKHPCWIWAEYVCLVTKRLHPEDDENRDTYNELGWRARLTVAFQIEKGLEKIVDLDCGVPKGWSGDRPGGRRFERLDKKNPMTWDYKGKAFEVDPKGKSVPLSKNTWLVEYVKEAPPTDDGRHLYELRTPLDLEEHRAPEPSLAERFKLHKRGG